MRSALLFVLLSVCCRPLLIVVDERGEVEARGLGE